MLRRVMNCLFPTSLWIRRFTYWWTVAFITIFVFDLMWMAQTTFRPFCFIAFYPYLLLNATLLSLPAVISRRAWIQAVVLLIADGIMIANLMYCRTYFNGIPAESYLLIGNLADFTDSVTESFRWYFSLLPLISLASWIGARYFVGTGDHRPKLIPYLITLLVLIFLTWLADAWRGQSLLTTVDKMRNECKENMCVLPVYQISGYVALDILSGNEKLTPETEQYINSWLEEHDRLTSPYYNKKAATDTTAHPKKLLIILCESLESWVLNKKVEGKEITPNLNRLLSDSTTFFAPNVMTQVGHGRSIDGQLLVMTGLLPHSSQVYAYQHPGNLYYSLPKAMKRAGGRSALLSGDKPQVWNQGLVAKAFGIDTLLHRSSWNFIEPDGKESKSLSDGALMSQTIEKLKRGEILIPGEKEMMVWITHSGHHPFKIEKKLQRIEFNDTYSESIADYMIAANYTDYAIGLLTDYLKTRPDWKETMIVITGDHEGLGQLRDKAVKDPNSARIVDPKQHTPLIIVNSPIHGQYGKEMGQVDIYSTLLDLMGWYDYPWKGMGQSVFDPSFPGAAYSPKLGIITDDKNVKPEILNHLKEAPKVSGAIIGFDMLAK